MKTDSHLPDGSPTTDSQVSGAAHGSAWRLISESKPATGDVIVCRAAHRDGGLMYWAGTVGEVDARWVTILTRGEQGRSFILTHDTQWVLVEKPNDQAQATAGDNLNSTPK